MKHVRCIEGVCYGPSASNDLGTHLQLIGNDFWYDISDWRGTARGVMGIIGVHAGNGLLEARQTASDEVVRYLYHNGAVYATGTINWDALLDLVMGKMDE